MKDIVELTKKEVSLLERLAVFMESRGLPPASAKTLALLTVSPQTELTFDQIMNTLGIAKSATSNALTQLQNLKQIEYSSHVGQRKRFFRLAPRDLENYFTDFLQKMKEIRTLYEEILENRPEATADFNASLRNRVEVIALISEALETTIIDIK